jgi:hypothetical protein
MDFPGRSSIASAYYSMCIYIKSTTVYLPKKKKKKIEGKEGRREGEFIFSDGLFSSLFTMRVDVSETNPHNGIKREKKGYVPRCLPQHLSLSNRNPT